MHFLHAGARRLLSNGRQVTHRKGTRIGRLAAVVAVCGVVCLAMGCRKSSEPYASPLDRLRADPSGRVRRQLFSERQPERDEMVDTVLRKATEIPITDAATIAAMRKVPRHAFLTVRHLVEKRAYIDRPLSIGHGFQTISDPSVVAAMMQLLELRPESKVLEIGTGSGYQASLLAEITRHVYTIEIIRDLAAEASDRIRLLGYDSVQARVGDGYFGWPEAAPFDAIIVTCAAGHIPSPLIAQLGPRGRMVIPVGNPYQVQRLILVTKDADGQVRTEDRLPVRFVPMTGTAQGSAAN